MANVKAIETRKYSSRRDNGSSAFDALSRFGIRSPADAERCVMYEWPLSRLEDLSRELREHGSLSTFRLSTGPFEFALSRSMAGGRGECECWDCRRARVSSTATFAAMYADRVFLVNPFWEYFEWPNLRHDEDRNREFHLRYQFAADVRSLLTLEPLFRAGIADLVTPGIAMCRDCSRRYALAVKKRRVEQCITSLERRYTSRCSAEVGESQFIIGPALNVFTPDELGDQVFSFPAPPRLVGRKGKRITPSDLAKLRPLRTMFRAVADDVIFQYGMSIALGAKYLTDRSLDAGVLSGLGGQPEARTSALLAKNLLCSIPVIANAPVKKLLAVRKHERESFILYRDAITKALNEVAAGRRTGHELRQIHADVIEPELARLQLRVRQLRSGPLFRGVDRALIVTGIIAAGVAGNIFPETLPQLIAAASGVHVLTELATSGLGRLRVPAEVKGDKFYFLWRLGVRPRAHA